MAKIVVRALVAAGGLVLATSAQAQVPKDIHAALLKIGQIEGARKLVFEVYLFSVGHLALIHS